MRIAQLSDLHLTADGTPLYGHVDTGLAVQQALRRIAALSPDFLVISGDIAENGSAPAYRRLLEWLRALPCAWGLLPGNHDCRATLRGVFADQPWSAGKLCCQRPDLRGGDLLLLDVTVPGEEGGEFGADQAAWLNAETDPGRPALLFMHHPPFAAGIPYMDGIRCRGEEALAAALARLPQIAAIGCGHLHRHVCTVFAGRPAVAAPSPAHQIAVDPGPLAYTLEPGGFLLHDWEPGERWLCHMVPVLESTRHFY